MQILLPLLGSIGRISRFLICITDSDAAFVETFLRIPLALVAHTGAHRLMKLRVSRVSPGRFVISLGTHSRLALLQHGGRLQVAMFAAQQRLEKKVQLVSGHPDCFSKEALRPTSRRAFSLWGLDLCRRVAGSRGILKSNPHRHLWIFEKLAAYLTAIRRGKANQAK